MTRLPAAARVKSPRFQLGITLIELMVAMVIGLILTAGVIQIFVGSQQTYRFQESLSRVQESGRYAAEAISRDLRGSDFRGCAGANPGNVTDLVGDGDSDFLAGAGAIVGFQHDGGWGDLAAAVTAEDPATDSDIVRLQSTAGGSTDVSEKQSKGANLGVEDASGFSQGDIVMATNCTDAVIFQIKNNPGGGGGTGKDTLTVAGEPAFYDTYNPTSVVKATVRYYFVAESEVGTEPALYRMDSGEDPEEMVRGVERMVAFFGEDTTGDERVDTYSRANGVSDWESVLSARVSLLVRGSEDNVTDESQTVSFPPGTDFTPGDRRLRQVFTTTIAIRNRLP